MGKGRGKYVDLALVMRILALIAVCCAIGLNASNTTDDWTSYGNVILYALGSMIVVLTIFLGWELIRDELDMKFVGYHLLIGGLFNLGAGIAAIVFKVDHPRSTGTLQLVGGILALVGGAVMFVDSLHNFGVF